MPHRLAAFVTADRYRVGTVQCVQDKEMKRSWCLANQAAEHENSFPYQIISWRTMP
jgi:hypothetical protein